MNKETKEDIKFWIFWIILILGAGMIGFLLGAEMDEKSFYIPIRLE